MKNYKRCFPLDGTFMNYGTKDIVYGYLQLIATFNPSSRELYIYHREYVKEKESIANIADCSIKTIERAVTALKVSGLIKFDEDRILITPSTNRYQLVDYNILDKLVGTGNHNIIRIYIYLLNKYLWKQEQSSSYLFTISELASAIGYNSFNSNISNRISRTLNILKDSGMIDFDYRYIEKRDGEKIIPVRKIELKYVASSIGDIICKYDKKSKQEFRF